MGPDRIGMGMSDMHGEILEEFIEDGREHLEACGRHLLSLEKSGGLEDLNAVLRHIHTIKGNAGFLDLDPLYGLLHRTENLLQTAREQDCLNCSTPLTELVFQVLDEVGGMLDRLAAGMPLADRPLDSLHGAIDDLGRVLEAEAAKVGETAPGTSGSDKFEKGVCFIKIGAADLITDAELQGNLTAQCEASDPETIVLDLRAIRSLDGARASSLLELIRELSSRKPAGILIDPEGSKGLLRVLRLKGLPADIPVFTDPDQARILP